MKSTPLPWVKVALDLNINCFYSYLLDREWNIHLINEAQLPFSEGLHCLV